jgi:hypothetical protein
MSWVITGSQKVNWDPSLITTALWLDAADANTINESGGVVSQWNDKSGNGRNVTQTTEANRPSVSIAALNAKNTITFDGSNDSLAGPSMTFGDYSLFLVCTPSSGTNDYIWQSYGLNPMQIAIISKFSGISYELFAGGTTPNRVTLSSSGSGFNIITHSRSSSSLTAKFNGGSEVGPLINFTTGNLTSTFRLGSALSGTVDNAACSMAEVIMTSAAASNDARQKVEGYLAHKWGLTANLPSDHPYKVNPPAP